MHPTGNNITCLFLEASIHLQGMLAVGAERAVPSPASTSCPSLLLSSEAVSGKQVAGFHLPDKQSNHLLLKQERRFPSAVVCFYPCEAEGDRRHRSDLSIPNNSLSCVLRCFDCYNVSSCNDFLLKLIDQYQRFLDFLISYRPKSNQLKSMYLCKAHHPVYSTAGC